MVNNFHSAFPAGKGPRRKCNILPSSTIPSRNRNDAQQQPQGAILIFTGG